MYRARIILFCAALYLLVGCNDDKDVAFDVVVPMTFSVDETSSSSIGKYFSIQSTLNALADPKVDKYKDRIKNVYINSIKYSISDVNPSGSVNISRIDLVLKSSLDPIATKANSQILATVAETEMEQYNDYEFAKLADQIKFNQQAIFNAQFSVSKTPIKFTITVNVSLKIVAAS